MPKPAVWSGDPKVEIFKDTMNSTYYDGYKGPISTATGAVQRGLRAGADVRRGRNRRLDAGGCGRGSGAACEALFPAAEPVRAGKSRRHCEERSDEAIHTFYGGMDCFASLAMTN